MITAADIDKMTAYLKIFNDPGFKPVLRPVSVEEKAHDDNVMCITASPPEYAQEVRGFFAAASKDCWIDSDYMDKHAEDMIRDFRKIREASLSRIRTMLTYCTRGERFCDGFWGDIFTSGVIHAILERLVEIREEDF